MNIKVVRGSNQPSWKLFSTVENTALDIMRSHVRAYDSDDDKLLEIYLDAALDYMQVLSDRLLGTHDVTVSLDLDDVKRREGITLPTCQDINDDLKIFYRKKDNTLSEDILSAQVGDPLEDNDDYIEDFDYIWERERYPALINLRNLPAKIIERSEFEEDAFQLTFTAGTALGSLPAQYSQAALLLLGHYYNMREAENIGGITSELKEGVKRLIQSVRQF